MMSRRGSDFAGVSVAITTPFKDGAVDVKTLKHQVDFQLEAGVNCIVPVGTTGESPTLSHTEHELVISEVIQHVGGRAKVMAGTGSNSTAEAIRLSKWAEKEGADALLLVAPYYNKPTQEGFFQHYKAVSQECTIPQCVYNIPGRSGANIEPSTITRLAEFQNITMVKEATGKMDQASQVLLETDLTVLSGDDSMTLPLMSIGGEGVVSVVANIVPGDLLKLVHAARDGRWDEAQKMHHKLFMLCRDLLSLATNPIPIKTAMMLLGRDNAEFRLPMTSLEQEKVADLQTTLFQYGIMDLVASK